MRNLWMEESTRNREKQTLMHSNSTSLAVAVDERVFRPAPFVGAYTTTTNHLLHVVHHLNWPYLPPMVRYLSTKHVAVCQQTEAAEDYRRNTHARHH